MQLDIGLDNGDAGGTAGNGMLEPGEVDDSRIICNGIPATGGCTVSSGAGAGRRNGDTSGGLHFLIAMGLAGAVVWRRRSRQG